MSGLYRHTVVALLILMAVTLITSCSNYDKEDLYGTWTGSIATPKEQLDAIRAYLPEHVDVSISDNNMIFSINRSKSYRWTNDFKITYKVEGEATVIFINRLIRVEMKGSWKYVFNKLDLSIKETDVSGRDKSTEQYFKNHPENREAFMPSKTGFLEFVRWNVEEVYPEELILRDDIYGRVHFKRFKR